MVAAVLVPMSLWRAALVLFHIEDSSPCILQARRKDVRKEGERGQWGIHKRVCAVLLLSFFTSKLPSLSLRAVPNETTRPHLDGLPSLRHGGVVALFGLADLKPKGPLIVHAPVFGPSLPLSRCYPAVRFAYRPSVTS